VEKRRLRARIRELRREVTPERAAAAAGAVTERVLALPGFSSVNRFALHAARPDELPTRPLFDALRTRGRSCLFPRCRDDGRLDFAPALCWEELVAGRYGISEPVTAAEPLGSEDWMIVPGVAFDRMGHRLGRGRAYYDRTFPPGGPSPRWIGIGYAFQCVEQVPADEHDRNVDVVITEAETWIVRVPETHGRGRS
jgi:5-formyltetrahydrofolate cyclo-ligase